MTKVKLIKCDNIYGLEKAINGFIQNCKKIINVTTSLSAWQREHSYVTQELYCATIVYEE